MARPRLRDAVIFVLVWAGALAGCQLIVPGDVPEFRCMGADPASCPAGMICDTSTFRCVSTPQVAEGGEDSLVPTADGGDASVDGDTPTPADIGGECNSERDCKKGLLCGTSTVLSSIVGSSANGICTKTCCTSADCPSSFVCFDPGTGGSYCVPASEAQREPTGDRTAGVTCTENGDCRSGLCDKGRCVDTCCSATDCATGTTCRILRITTPPPARDGWACAAPEQGAEIGATCSGSVKCQNDNCSSVPQRCRPPCCSTEQCVAVTGQNFAVCAYGTIFGSNTNVKWCFDSNAKGPTPLGGACSGHPDCETFLCDFGTKKCVAACCEDTDCPDNEVCRPSPVGTPLLRCVSGER